MVRMVDDLFELSRHPRRRCWPSYRSRSTLGDLVSEALAGADPVARAHGVAAGGQVDAGLLVPARPGAALARGRRNLVMNAIRHTPADGVVAISRRSP